MNKAPSVQNCIREPTAASQYYQKCDTDLSSELIKYKARCSSLEAENFNLKLELKRSSEKMARLESECSNLLNQITKRVESTAESSNRNNLLPSISNWKSINEAVLIQSQKLLKLGTFNHHGRLSIKQDHHLLPPKPVADSAKEFPRKLPTLAPAGQSLKKLPSLSRFSKYPE